MARKSTKPSPRPAAGKAHMTEEEKNNKIARYVIQKRNSYAEAILFNLCQRRHAPFTKRGRARLVNSAVEMADNLFMHLNPGLNIVPESKEENETEEE